MFLLPLVADFVHSPLICWLNFLSLFSNDIFFVVFGPVPIPSFVNIFRLISSSCVVRFVCGCLFGGFFFCLFVCFRWGLVCFTFRSSFAYCRSFFICTSSLKVKFWSLAQFHVDHLPHRLVSLLLMVSLQMQLSRWLLVVDLQKLLLRWLLGVVSRWLLVVDLQMQHFRWLFVVGLLKQLFIWLLVVGLQMQLFRWLLVVVCRCNFLDVCWWLVCSRNFLDDCWWLVCRCSFLDDCL